MNNSSNQFLNHWINFWTFIFCITVIALNGHGGEAAIILLLTMIYVYFFNHGDQSKYKLSRDEIIFVTLVILFWLLNVLNTLFQPEGLEYENTRRALRAIDNPMRWLLMLPIFFLFRRYVLDWKVISIGLSIGVFISFGFAFYDVYFLNIQRTSGTMNHVITYGEIMVAVDLLLWMFMIFAWNQNKKILTAILFIASTTAFFGALLSETRGALIVYIFFIIGYIIYSLKSSKFDKKKLFYKTVLLRFFLIFILFFLASETEKYQHMKGFTVWTFDRISQGEYEEASGGRLSNYKPALKIPRYFPFGVGTDNFRTGGKAVIVIDALNHENVTVKNQLHETLEKDSYMDLHKHQYLRSFNKDGSLKFTSQYRHAHNEWLNVLAENGLAGIILLTLLFAFPIKILSQSVNHENKLVVAYSYCGIILILSFVIFGQTQSIFTSHAALIFFIFLLFLFLAQISRLKNINDNHDSVY